MAEQGVEVGPRELPTLSHIKERIITDNVSKPGPPVGLLSTGGLGPVNLSDHGSSSAGQLRRRGQAANGGGHCLLEQLVTQAGRMAGATVSSDPFKEPTRV